MKSRKDIEAAARVFLKHATSEACAEAGFRRLSRVLGLSQRIHDLMVVFGSGYRRAEFSLGPDRFSVVYRTA